MQKDSDPAETDDRGRRLRRLEPVGGRPDPRCLRCRRSVGLGRSSQQWPHDDDAPSTPRRLPAARTVHQPIHRARAPARRGASQWYPVVGAGHHTLDRVSRVHRAWWASASEPQGPGLRYRSSLGPGRGPLGKARGKPPAPSPVSAAPHHSPGGNATQCRSYPASGDGDVISPLGKWSLAATVLMWYPGYVPPPSASSTAPLRGIFRAPPAAPGTCRHHW